GKRDIGARRGGRVAISRCLAVEISTGKLDPGAAVLEQSSNHSKSGMRGTGRLRQAAEMVEDHGAVEPAPKLGRIDDLIAAHVDLHVPAHAGHSGRLTL